VTPKSEDPDALVTLRSRGRPGEHNRLGDTDIDEPTLSNRPEGRWRLNALGVVLLCSVLASLAVSAALWAKLSGARAEMAATDAAEEKARLKQEQRLAEQAQQSAAVTPPPAPTPAVTPAPAAPQRLLLLLTVGTQHYAEKQMRLLQPKCSQAKLRVYQQRRGRCGWATCFAVAVEESEAAAARGCGEPKGQSLRDKADFVAIR
jgi:hypothetical protein